MTTSVVQTRLLLALVALLCFPVAAEGAPLDPNAFTSLGTLDVSSGTLTFNTSTLQVTGAASFTGVLHPQGPGLPDIAVFTFDEVNVTSGVMSVGVIGSRPFALLSQSDLTISSPSFGVGGGQVGGGVGGAIGMPGSGPGAGAAGGNGGGFGGAGGGTGGGLPYGDLNVALQAGSGGGGDGTTGGGGGGAIELGAVGTISTNSLSVNGTGGVASPGGFGAMVSAGGGGSGGAILLHGRSITGTGTLSARGGVGGNGSNTNGGDGGGGGRISAIVDVYTIGVPLPNASITGGSGGSSGGFAGSPGMPGSTGVQQFLFELTVVPAGQVVPMGSDGTVALSFGGSQSFSDRLSVDAGGLVFATAAVSSAHDLILQGGLVAVSSGWTMTGTSALSGFGQLSAPFVGGVTNHVATTGGTLTLGDANSTAGFSFAGVADIEAGATLNLLDADAAELGAVTTLAGGGRLNSLNGVHLSAGEIVTASAAAEIAGEFTNQGTVNGPTAAGEFLTFTGDVNGPGNYTGNVLFSDSFSPGASPAQVSFEHVAFDATAELSIELGGTTPGGQFDQLAVAGDATLGGQLTLSLIDGFTPSAGQSWEILDVGGTLSGSFAGLEEGDFVVALSTANLYITYEAGDGNDVALLAALPGDFDHDGDVDGRDFLVWQRGGSPSPLSGSDLAAWQTQYGIAPLVAASIAVPEPSVWWLLVATCCFSQSRGTRRATHGS